MCRYRSVSPTAGFIVKCSGFIEDYRIVPLRALGLMARNRITIRKFLRAFLLFPGNVVLSSFKELLTDFDFYW